MSEQIKKETDKVISAEETASQSVAKRMKQLQTDEAQKTITEAASVYRRQLKKLTKQRRLQRTRQKRSQRSRQKKMLTRGDL